MSGEDLTDPKNNPLIPSSAEDKPIAGDLTDPAQNELIPPDAYRVRPNRPPIEVPDRPSVEFVQAVLAKFIETSNAADFEKVKATLR